MNRAEIHHRVFVYSLLALAIALPLLPRFSNVFVFILAANWIAEGGHREKFRLLKQNPVIALFIVFYLMYVIGVLYSTNASAAGSSLERKFTLFVLPLVVGTSLHSIGSKVIDRILISFTVSCLLYSLISIGYGSYMWATQKTSLYLIGEELTYWGGLQSIYFGIYVALVAAILMNFLLTRQLSVKSQSIILGLIGYFFIVMILLSARMGTIAFGFIIVVGGFYYARQRNSLKWFFIAGIALAIVGSVLIFKIDYLRDRVMSIVDTKFYFDPEENNANGLTLRLVKWQCSLEGWSTSPIIGVGTGDTQDVLQECYKAKNFWGAVFEFNSHNQFLQTALALGAIGLLVLSASFIYPAILSFRQRHYLYLGFLVIVALSFLTESVLERMQGVVFVAFFHSLFIYSLLHKETNPA